ncbi:MAG: CAP domain-containing protein [Bradymonadaceae bacterium]
MRHLSHGARHFQVVLLSFLLIACGDDFWDESSPEDEDLEQTVLDEPAMQPAVDMEEELEGLIEAVIVATNAVRSNKQNCGVHGHLGPSPAVHSNAALNEAAQAHVDDMNQHQFISHIGTDGGDFTDRIEDAGYDGVPVGENIAATNRQSKELLEGWLASDDHCRVLMRPDAREIGVGLGINGGDGEFTFYWVQVFGG